MTSVEIKREISKVLDQVPEELLVDILDLIKKVQTERSSAVSLASNFKKILLEDSEVLHKLSQ